MHDIFITSLVTAGYAVGITLAWTVIVFCFIASLVYLKHMRYYHAIYKHPEVFGDPKQIPWEVKKKLMGKMAKRVENAVKELDPNADGVGLKLYVPDEAESA